MSGASSSTFVIEIPHFGHGGLLLLLEEGILHQIVVDLHLPHLWSHPLLPLVFQLVLHFLLQCISHFCDPCIPATHGLPLTKYDECTCSTAETTDQKQASSPTGACVIHQDKDADSKGHHMRQGPVTAQPMDYSWTSEKFETITNITPAIANTVWSHHCQHRVGMHASSS